MDLNKILLSFRTTLHNFQDRQPSELARTAVLCGVQAFVIIVCLIIFLQRYSGIYVDQRVAATYMPTQCTIIAQKMTTADGSGGVGYRANFFVSYIVNGVQMKAAVAANGLDFTFVADGASQQAFLDQYKIGQQYPCWYNPNQPDVSVLVLRHDWSAGYGLIIPLVVLLVVAFYFINTARKLRDLYKLREM